MLNSFILYPLSHQLAVEFDHLNNHIEIELLEYAKILSRKDFDFDIALTFYYDETNSIRKLHLKKGDFNVDYNYHLILWFQNSHIYLLK